jgi:hypothetical protein
MDQTSESEKKLQRQKFEEIIEILLSAGYFRARIHSLSDFDKVVGGLCWCITLSGEDVDVDILFQENSTIGQKIALSEKIVKALRKMNCPSPIQPHQIQGGVGGSDYTSIYPVIVWLVKKFIERRDERESKLRSYALTQFSKNYQIPSEAKASYGVSNELNKIIDRNKSVRKYRRRDMPGESEAMRVHACLLEYGETIAYEAPSNDVSLPGGKSLKGLVPNELPSSGEDASYRINIGDTTEISFSKLSNANANELTLFEKKLMQAAKEAQREEQLFAEQASKTEAELLRQMSSIRGDDGSLISKSHVGAIVGLGSDEIGAAAAAYEVQIEEGKKLVEENLASGKLGQAAAFKRQEQSLTKQLDEVRAKRIEIENAYSLSKEKLHLLEEEYKDVSDYNEKLQMQITKLTDLENKTSKKEELAQLKELIVLNESLKVQEAAFKATCKAQVEDYNQRIKSLEEANDENSEEQRKYREIEDMHSKVMAKYNRLREMLAEANIEVSSSSRLIDDVPTRTELIQYERRFGELYQQVAWKLEETRKYYNQYNTLESELSYMQKEIKLLNSISENFKDAMKNSSSKTDFLKNFESIVKGVEVGELLLVSISR